MTCFLCVFVVFLPLLLTSLKIGIIGGGFSGLFLSRNLRENGFNDITIFEKDNKVSPIVKSYTVDENVGAIDLTAKFIPIRTYVSTDPNSGFSDIYYPLRLIINDVEEYTNFNTSFLKAPITYWDLSTDTFSVPYYIIRYSNNLSKLISELSRGILILHNIIEYTSSISDIYNIGITLKGENLNNWGKRNNLTIFAEVLGQISDSIAAEILNKNKFGKTHSASYILKRSSMLSIGVIRTVLLGLGVNENNYDNITDPDGFIREVLSLKLTYSSYKFRYGYENFIKNVAEVERIKGVNIKLNSQVIGLKIKRSGIEIVVKENNIRRKSYYFDAVFFTIRPSDAVKILKHGITKANNDLRHVFKLYSDAVNDKGAFLVPVWNLTSLNNWLSPLLTQPIIGFQPFSNSFGTMDSGLDAMNLPCFPFSGYHDFPSFPFFASNLFGVDINGDLIDIDTCIDYAASYLRNEFNLSVTSNDVIDYFYTSIYPYVLSTELENNNWYEDFEKLQGKNGLFYLGEIFSTQTAFQILRYIDQNIPKYVEKLNQIV